MHVDFSQQIGLETDRSIKVIVLKFKYFKPGLERLDIWGKQ